MMHPRNDLILSLRNLCATEYPINSWETPPHLQAEKLREAQEKTLLHIAKRLVSLDNKAAEFVESVKRSLPDQYCDGEALAEAKRQAPTFLADLLSEQKKLDNETEETRYKRERNEIDPFIDADTNVNLDHLMLSNSSPLRTHRLESGEIEIEDDGPVPLIGRPTRQVPRNRL